MRVERYGSRLVAFPSATLDDIDTGDGIVPNVWVCNECGRCLADDGVRSHLEGHATIEADRLNGLDVSDLDIDPSDYPPDLTDPFPNDTDEGCD